MALEGVEIVSAIYCSFLVFVGSIYMWREVSKEVDQMNNEDDRHHPHSCYPDSINRKENLT